jgi:hypothetical protein
LPQGVLLLFHFSFTRLSANAAASFAQAIFASSSSTLAVSRFCVSCSLCALKKPFDEGGKSFVWVLAWSLQ